MLNKIVTAMLMGVLLSTTLGVQSVFGQTNGQTGKIRSQVYKFGIGKKVEVRLRDKTKFKGTINKIEKDSFTVSNKSGKENVFAYNEVDRVKKSGLSSGVWIAIGAGAAIGAVILILVSKRCSNEGGSGLCL